MNCRVQRSTAGEEERVEEASNAFLYIGICFILELHSSNLILRKISLSGAGKIGT